MSEGIVFEDTCYISQKYIEEGSIESPSSCPIALWMWDHFPQAVDVNVTNTRIEMFIDDGYLYIAHLSNDLQAWIRDYDEGMLIMNPIEFKVEFESERIPEAK